MTDKLQHHELTAEWLDDDQGRAIMLTQADGSGCNEASTILLSPWQLRAVCEKFDLLATSDPQAAKHIATLERRLRLLRDRINHLGEYLALHSDSEHADLSYEQTYATATADIADEFCAELEGVQACTEPPKQTHTPGKPSTGTDPRQMSIDA
jgi:hypothetical protein